MKLILLFIAAVLTLSAHAKRTGTDERIHTCTTGDEKSPMGRNEKFRVHVKNGNFIKLTRLSDNKWFTAVPEVSGKYVFAKGERGGNLWKTGQSGYMDDVEKDELRVNYAVSHGVYEGVDLKCELSRVISEFAPLTPTELALKDIGDNANLANGDYEFQAINLKTFDLEKEFALLHKEAKDWDGCTWTRMSDREEVLEMIKDTAYDPEAAEKIKDLETDPGLFNLIAMISDDDISCSQRYVSVYTADGFRLDLFYSQGD